MSDTAQLATATLCSIVGMGLPIVLLVVIKLAPGRAAKANAASLARLAPGLGLTPETRKLRVHWMAEERVHTVFSGQLQGRKVAVHYQRYVRQTSLGRQAMGGIGLPIAETWVHASIWPPLGLGADEPSVRSAFAADSAPGHRRPGSC